MSFPYKPMLRGKFEFEDLKNNNEWTDEKSYRICLQIGNEYNSDQFLESIRFYRSGSSSDQWKVQSVKEHNPLDSVTMGFYCIDQIDSEEFDNDGHNEIEFVEESSTFDPATRKFSFEFTRPFDISINHGLTLIGTFKYDVWLTWVIANSRNAVQTSRNDKIY